MNARVLIDTSIWIDYLAHGDAQVAQLLHSEQVLMHPFVIGEIACGSLKDRDAVLRLLRDLPQAPLAQHEEVLELMRRHTLYGTGIGWIDAHLLSSVALSAQTQLWSRDRRLRDAAASMRCAFDGAGGNFH